MMTMKVNRPVSQPAPLPRLSPEHPTFPPSLQGCGIRSQGPGPTFLAYLTGLLMKLPSRGHRALWHEAPVVGPSGRWQVVEPDAGNRTRPESGSERLLEPLLPTLGFLDLRAASPGQPVRACDQLLWRQGHPGGSGQLGHMLLQS